MTSRRLLCAAAFAIVLSACRSRQIPKLIVLGIDGMDPVFVERHWSALPNLSKLRDQGYFGRLATTDPPQSPVAWSTFITGLEPAEHGVFDFVHRDAQTLQPFSSMSRTGQPRWSLPVGPYILPLAPSHVVSLRRGTPFWQSLADRGITVDIVRMPTNYPPVRAGTALSGMGTPDLRGTLGTFTFYTNDPEEVSRAVSGGRIVKVHLRDGRTALPLEGPPNSLRQDQAYTSVDLIAETDRDAPLVRLASGEEVVILRQGEWSAWIAADFPLIPHLSSVRGTFRIFAKQIHPRFELYVSPVNIDPLSPALPVSVPAQRARAIAEETGRYFTLGIPQDTAALRQKVFTRPEFLVHANLVFNEEHNLLRFALRHFSGGLLFFYVSSIDQGSHVLWGKHDVDLLETYRKVDNLVAEVRQASPSTPLIILSDHGFAAFDRAVHLNTWLKDRGFLNLNSPPGEDTTLQSVEWSSTEAYAIGLNGLYLNRKGRERQGIVAPGDPSSALIANLREQLLAWRDPANGRQVVESLAKINAPAATSDVAPDLIVGYARGYRASWLTALGGTAPTELENNTDAWIADHCINPADVPGVLFTSFRLQPSRRRLSDVTAMISGFFANIQ